MSEPERLTPDELRTLFLFEQLSDKQLSWLSERGHHPRRGRPGLVLPRAALGDPGDVEAGPGW